MWQTALFLVLLVGLLYIVGMRVTPNSKAFMLMERCYLGGAVLYLYNFIGAFFGITIGINLITCLITGLLGVPGMLMLVILRFTG